jgi:4,5-dihydroxyphthalate decarboxylase
VSALKTVVGPYRYLDSLKSGHIAVAGTELAFIEINPLIAAYRRMVRELAYDVCELAVTTYIVAKSFGKGFTALPLPLNRMFHFGDIQVGLDTGIDRPADLAGKRVGVRAYTVTTGVWVRGILQSEFGVDPASITWITDDEEHVGEFVAPPNVAGSGGTSLVDLFQAGKIDAAFSGRAGLGRTGAPREGWDKGGAAPVAVQTTRPFRALFPNAAELDRAWYLRTGIYPIHGVLCVRDSVLAERPDLPRKLFDAFSRAKEEYLTQLAAAGPQTADDAKWVALQAIVGPDPLPFGLDANVTTIQALIDYAYQQRLISKRYAPDELFLPIS